MATLDELLARKSALEASIASGAEEVAFDGRRVRYRSTAEQMQALALVNSDIAELSGGTASRLVRAGTGKGLI